jgi:hypothetical protein
MPKKYKPIIVTVSDEKLKNIHEVAAQLAAKGMKVDQIMPATGIITGSSSAAKMPALKKVDGILSVEEEAIAYLPPPDSPVQ